MLYIVGLGLNLKGISLEGLSVVKKCKKVYLESYTVEFPYSVSELRKVIGKKVVELGREDVESDRLVKEAMYEDVCLLVYGSPLFATTHMSLVQDCRERRAKVKVKVIYSASVFDAIARTGLQLYKFGKISSMPAWKKNFEPDSFMDFVIENKKINAHSLILVDIGLKFEDALNELIIAGKNKNFEFGQIVVCSLMGTDKERVYYSSVERLRGKKIKGEKVRGLKVGAPYCFVIPGEMHFFEKEVLEGFD